MWVWSHVPKTEIWVGRLCAFSKGEGVKEALIITALAIFDVVGVSQGDRRREVQEGSKKKQKNMCRKKKQETRPEGKLVCIYSMGNKAGCATTQRLAKSEGKRLRRARRCGGWPWYDQVEARE